MNEKRKLKNHIKNKKNKGMLLIDVILSIAILAIITITTARLLYQALRDKSKIEKKIEFESKINTIRNLLISDIQKAFNFQNIRAHVHEKANTKIRKYLKDGYRRYQNLNSNNSNNKNSSNSISKKSKDSSVKDPTIPKNEADLERNLSFQEISSPKVLTHFLGNKESLYFTTLNNTRTLKNSQISELVEVGYFVRTCLSQKNKRSKSRCLWRSLSFIIDDDVKKGGKERVVLENVKKITLSYISSLKKDNKSSKRWKNKWRSNYLGNSTTRGKFPAAVKILLEFQIEKIKNKLQTQTLDFIIPLGSQSHITLLSLKPNS